MIHLNDENFNELIKEGFHLVDYFAEWCGPCKMLAPVLEELTDVSIIKVDVDQHNDIATEYGVMTIPTMIFFKDGEEVERVVGFRGKEDIEEIIKKHTN